MRVERATPESPGPIRAQPGAKSVRLSHRFGLFWTAPRRAEARLPEGG